MVRSSAANAPLTPSSPRAHVNPQPNAAGGRADLVTNEGVFFDGSQASSRLRAGLRRRGGAAGAGDVGPIGPTAPRLLADRTLADEFARSARDGRRDARRGRAHHRGEFAGR